MIPDERYIEIIAKRMSEEVSWEDASKMFSHRGFIDLVTHLWTEKGLAVQLLKAYETDIVNALAKEKLAVMGETGADYVEWKADVKTRGGM